MNERTHHLPHDSRIMVLSTGLIFAVVLVLAYLILLIGRAQSVF